MIGSMNGTGSASPVREFWLAAECGALFAGVPVACAAGWMPVSIIPLLVVMAGLCWLVLRRQRQRSGRPERPDWTPGREWRRILRTYALALPVMVVLLWFIRPAALLSLPARHPGIWLLVMVAYPVISVLPQELIYRVFFFERYDPLFGRGRGMLAANAAAFSLGHLVFHNWPAVLLTLAGGWLFARTYQRTRSWGLVAAEHALYGCAVFTLGYGGFFYEGTLRWFQP